MKKTSNFLNCYCCQCFLIFYFTHTSLKFEFHSLGTRLSMAPKSPTQIPSSVDSNPVSGLEGSVSLCNSSHRLEEVCVFSSVPGIEPRASCTLGSTTGLFSMHTRLYHRALLGPVLCFFSLIGWRLFSSVPCGSLTLCEEGSHMPLWRTCGERHFGFLCWIVLCQFDRS